MWICEGQHRGGVRVRLPHRPKDKGRILVFVFDLVRIEVGGKIDEGVSSLEIGIGAGSIKFWNIATVGSTYEWCVLSPLENYPTALIASRNRWELSDDVRNAHTSCVFDAVCMKNRLKTYSEQFQHDLAHIVSHLGACHTMSPSKAAILLNWGLR